MQVVYSGRLAGEFTGFDGDMVFETCSGGKWKQSEYKYWYHYEYMPLVEIKLENDGRYYLYVADNSVPVVPD